jgi:hypothetical protein
LAESTFRGYAWSLDIFVDYVWKELTSLSVVLVALLVVEVRRLLYAAHS